MSLKERWNSTREKLTSRFADKIFNTIKPDVVIDLLKANRTIVENNSPRDYEHFEKINTAQREVTLLQEKYSSAITLIEEYRDAYAQDKKADLVDRLRYLVFRIATAIGIAAVILTTGYLAHRWNIPLTLLRVAA
jgi:hypothetical protein